jgi:hypothetical protein
MVKHSFQSWQEKAMLSSVIYSSAVHSVVNHPLSCRNIYNPFLLFCRQTCSWNTDHFHGPEEFPCCYSYKDMSTLFLFSWCLVYSCKDWVQAWAQDVRLWDTSTCSLWRYMLPCSPVSYSFKCDVLMLISLAMLTSCKY